MLVFAVFLNEENSGVVDRLKEAYPDHYRMAETFFLVASDTIAEEIAITVGIKGDNRVESARGVVFKLNDAYAGYTGRALWEWLRKIEGQG